MIFESNYPSAYCIIYQIRGNNNFDESQLYDSLVGRNNSWIIIGIGSIDRSNRCHGDLLLWEIFDRGRH